MFIRNVSWLDVAENRMFTTTAVRASNCRVIEMASTPSIKWHVARGTWHVASQNWLSPFCLELSEISAHNVWSLDPPIDQLTADPETNAQPLAPAVRTVT
jgi:hypothetical protein